MEREEEAFFREASLRICGSLDIEKALQRCLVYIKQYIPAKLMVLSFYDDTSNMAEIVAVASSEESRVVSIKIPYTPRVKEDMAKRRSRADKFWRVRQFGDYEGTRELAVELDVSEKPGVVMDLILEEAIIGMLTVVHERNTVYTDDHFRLLRLLNSPFSIALSNYRRYRQVQMLQAQISEDYQYLQDDLYRHYGSDVIGAEYGLKGVMRMVGRVAPQNSPALLLGETGVGKEVIAREIHRLSHRRDKPFIGVNCGAIPESLMDSELFGHEEGAFTGASSRRRGRFERAQGGTIFLDEIGELNSHAQIRLLRVLQEKEIERVGGAESIKTDIRVIAATNDDLETRIREDRFREDLYFRLKVFPIIIPPLRDRVIDIPALVSYFIDKKALEMKINPRPTIAPGQIDMLMTYSWPGNVRELENVVERALILLEGSEIRFEGLIGLPHVKNETESSLPEGTSLNLEDTIAAAIRKALRVAGGKISGPGGAADLLGIHPMTLRHKMGKLGIPFGRSAKHLYVND